MSFLFISLILSCQSLRSVSLISKIVNLLLTHVRSFASLLSIHRVFISRFQSRLLERFAIGLGSRTLFPSPRTLVMNLDLEEEGKSEVDGPEVSSLICKKGSPERNSSEAIESSSPIGENSSNDINKGKGRSPPLPFESPQQRLKELGWIRHDAWMRRKGSSGS